MAEKQYINPNNPVYISYSWADKLNPNLEDDINELCPLMDEKGIFYKRDKASGPNSLIPYRGNIMDSEAEIGKADAVIIVLSNKYFQSLNCLYELHCIFDNDNYTDRIFVVKLPGTYDITIQNILDGYLSSAQTRLEKLAAKGFSGQSSKIEDAFVNNDGYKVDIKLLSNYLKENNIPCYELLKDKGYSMVIDALEKHVLMLAHKVSDNNESTISAPILDLTSPVLNYRPDVNGLVARTKLTEELYNQLQDNQFVNMTGIGGMGKTSLSYLFVNEYADKYNKIAHVLVNGDFYSAVDEQIGKSLNVRSYDSLIETFTKITSDSQRPNLLIIDVNESANYQQVSEAIDVMRRRGMKNWKVLIIARVKIFSNVVEFTPFEIGGCDLDVAKSIFFNYLNGKSKDYQYSDDDFMDLFDTLFYSPLLIEQLAKYLLRNRSLLSKDSILNYIKGDGQKYGLQQQKLNSGTIDEQRLAKYEIINIFLSHLSEFSELDSMYKQDNQLRDIVRHMMLWETNYYSIDTIFAFVKGLIVSEDVLREALNCLCDLRILDYSDTEHGYKMHGLMAETFRKQVLEDVANSGFRNYSQYFKNIIELGYIKDEESPITKRIYATLDDNDFMEKYYWKTLKPKPITEELIEEYNMVKVEGHDFYICKYAVSQGDWEKIYGKKNNPSYFKKGDNYPVEQVSWYDAMLYIMKLNNETGLCFRLPSEVEWEWACKCSKAHKRNVDDVAWHYENSDRSTHPVWKTPTPIPDDEDHGIKNMLGNVWEWCSGWYSKGGSYRVRRGGSWSYDAGYASSSSRDYWYSYYRNNNLGFRLALQFKK